MSTERSVSPEPDADNNDNDNNNSDVMHDDMGTNNDNDNNNSNNNNHTTNDRNSNDDTGSNHNNHLHTNDEDHHHHNNNSPSPSPEQHQHKEPRVPSNKDNRTLHVSAVSRKCTDEELKELFSKHGEVERCHLVIDPHTKEHRGFGFITMKTKDDLTSALDKLDRTEFMGQVINVQLARRGEPHEPTPGVYVGARTTRDRRSDRPHSTTDHTSRTSYDRQNHTSLPPPIQGDRYPPRGYHTSSRGDDRSYPPHHSERYSDRYSDRYAYPQHASSSERYSDRYSDRYSSERYSGSDRYSYDRYSYDRFPERYDRYADRYDRPPPDRYAPPSDRYYDDRRYDPYRR